MDIRGYCDSCDRWFTFVVEQFDGVICEWCGRPPIRVEAQRIMQAPERVGTDRALSGSAR